VLQAAAGILLILRLKGAAPHANSTQKIQNNLGLVRQEVMRWRSKLTSLSRGNKKLRRARQHQLSVMLDEKSDDLHRALKSTWRAQAKKDGLIKKYASSKAAIAATIAPQPTTVQTGASVSAAALLGARPEVQRVGVRPLHSNGPLPSVDPPT